MSRSTRLGTGSKAKVNYQRLSQGAVPDHLDFHETVTPTPKRPRITSSPLGGPRPLAGPRAGRGGRKGHGTPVRHLHTKGGGAFGAVEPPLSPWEYWPCSQCGKRFDSDYKLVRHWDYCEGGSGGVAVACPLCAKEFGSLGAIDDHMTLAHGDLYAIAEANGDEPFSCPYCTDKFSSFVPLAQHQVHVHEVYPDTSPAALTTLPTEVQCCACELSFPTVADLAEHMDPLSLCTGTVHLDPPSTPEELEAQFLMRYPRARVGLRVVTATSRKLSHRGAPRGAKGAMTAGEKRAMQNERQREAARARSVARQLKRNPLTRPVIRVKSSLKDMTPEERKEHFRFKRLQWQANRQHGCPSVPSNRGGKRGGGCTTSSLLSRGGGSAFSTLDAIFDDVLQQEEAEEYDDLLPSNGLDAASSDEGGIGEITTSRLVRTSPVATVTSGSPCGGKKGAGGGGLLARVRQIRDLKRQREAIGAHGIQERGEPITGIHDQPAPIDWEQSVLAAAESDYEEPASEATFEDFLKDLEVSAPVIVKPKPIKPPKPAKPAKPVKPKPVVKASPRAPTPAPVVSPIAPAQGIYACPLCTNSFDLLRIRDDHLRADHRGEKLFACQVCGTSFALYGNLRGHCRRIHPESLHDALYGGDTLRHECPQCQLPFVSASVLRQHAHIMHRNLGSEAINRIVESSSTTYPKMAPIDRGSRGGRGGGVGKGRGRPKGSINRPKKPEAPSTDLIFGRYESNSCMIEEDFICTECSAEFPDEASLQLHMNRDHPQSGGEETVVALATMADGVTAGKKADRPGPKSSKSLPASVAAKSRLPPPQPPVVTPCKKSFPSGEEAHVCCRDCREFCHNMLEFEVHNQEHEEMTSSVDQQQLGCQLCGRVFTGRYARPDLIDHSRFEHAKPPAQGFPCPRCHTVFALQRELARHHKGANEGGLCGPKNPPPTCLEDVVVYGCVKCSRIFAGSNAKTRYDWHRARCGSKQSVGVEIARSNSNSSEAPSHYETSNLELSAVS